MQEIRQNKILSKKSDLWNGHVERKFLPKKRGNGKRDFLPLILKINELIKKTCGT